METNKSEITVYSIETAEEWENGKTVRVGGQDNNGFTFYAWANPTIPLESQFPNSNLGTWDNYNQEAI